MQTETEKIYIADISIAKCVCECLVNDWYIYVHEILISYRFSLECSTVLTWQYFYLLRTHAHTRRTQESNSCLNTQNWLFVVKCTEWLTIQLSRLIIHMHTLRQFSFGFFLSRSPKTYNNWVYRLMNKQQAMTRYEFDVKTVCAPRKISSIFHRMEIWKTVDSIIFFGIWTFFSECCCWFANFPRLFLRLPLNSHLIEAKW